MTLREKIISALKQVHPQSKEDLFLNIQSMDEGTKITLAEFNAELGYLWDMQLINFISPQGVAFKCQNSSALLEDNRKSTESSSKEKL